MAEVMLNEGATRMRQQVMQGTGTPQLVARLFTNNVVPAVTDTLASYTGCTLAGYADVPLPGLTWTGGAAGGEDDAAADPVFQIIAPYAGGVTIYGYVIFENTGPAVGVWADVFPAPFAVPAGGAVIAISLSSRVKIA